MPQELGLPEQESAAELSPAVLDANTESFFANFFDPHLGQGVPSHRLERISSSLSAPHFSQ
jgi:hypothetical protein